MASQSISALAARAATALDLVEAGITDPAVLRELEPGVRFCEALETGHARASSEYFSARSLAVENLVLSMPRGRTLADEVSKIKEDLQTVRSTLSAGHTPDAALVIKLRDYFADIAERLPFYEGVRDRIAAGMRKRG